LFKGLVGGITRDSVEHVDNVKERRAWCGGKVGCKGAVDILVELGLGGVKEEIDAAADGNTKLTFFEEENGEVVSIESHDDGTGHAAVGCPDTDGPELGDIVRIFM
jgi:hypothetical protein